MNIEIVDLGLVGRETKGNLHPDCPEMEPEFKGFFRTLDDDYEL